MSVPPVPPAYPASPVPAGPAGPDRWPSAWPDLWPGVVSRAAFGLTACLVTAGGLAWLGDLSLSWWVPLLPALLLIGPLRRPARVRRGFVTATASGRLPSAGGRAGATMYGPVHGVAAEVSARGTVRYLDTRRYAVARRR